MRYIFYYFLSLVFSIFLYGLFVVIQKRNNYFSIQHKNLRLYCVLLFIFPLFLLSALRWDVGTDTWHTYTPEYLAMKAEYMPLTSEEEEILLTDRRLVARYDQNYSVEEANKITLQEATSWFAQASKHTSPGFQALEKLLILMNADVQWLYVITSAWILFFIVLAIMNLSDVPALTCLMFVITSNYFLSLNIVSQYMAISMCLFSYKFVENHRPLQFFLLVLAAASFHISALVFLPVYFLSQVKLKPHICAILVISFLIVAPLFVPLLEKMIGIIAPKYTRYFGRNPKFEWVFFAIGISVFIVGSYYYNVGKDLPFYNLWYYTNILGLLSLCFSGSVPLMKRINYYFAAPHFLFLPLVIQCEKIPFRQKALKFIIIFLFIAETIVAVGIMNKNGVLPYQTIFHGTRVDLSLQLANIIFSN